MQKFISHLKKYISLSPTEIETLASYVKSKTFKKKDFLLREGQICKANYFVETGLLRMFFNNDKGVEQITHFALENWWIADYMSIVMQCPSEFNIQAVENSEIVIIDTLNQDELFEKLPQLEKYFRMVMQRAYAAS